MGYMRHDVIIVTCWDENRVKRGHAKAKELGLPVSPIVKSPRNSYMTFMVVPDGSKEGWDFSNEMDVLRAKFEQWMIKTYDENFLDWVHINFGGDEPSQASIVAKTGDKEEN